MYLLLIHGDVPASHVSFRGSKSIPNSTMAPLKHGTLMILICPNPDAHLFNRIQGRIIRRQLNHRVDLIGMAIEKNKHEQNT